MDEEESYGSGTVWNFDDAESRLIFEMKVEFLNEIRVFNIENAYWKLWVLMSEIKPLFEDSTKKEVNKKFSELTDLRNSTNKFEDLTESKIGEIASAMIKFYEQICDEAVSKGYYFRKQKEYVGL